MNLKAWLCERLNRAIGRSQAPVAAPWPHYVAHALYPDRCLYCHAKEGTAAFGKPCPRRRPHTELA